MRKPLVSSVVCVATFCFAFEAAAQAWRPSVQMVAKLEAVVQIPGGNGTAPLLLTQYARFYDGGVIGGHRIIKGEYVLAAMHGNAPGVFIVDSARFPHVVGGGCNIVNVTYDVVTSRIVSIMCNGG